MYIFIDGPPGAQRLDDGVAAFYQPFRRIRVLLRVSVPSVVWVPYGAGPASAGFSSRHPCRIYLVFALCQFLDFIDHVEPFPWEVEIVAPEVPVSGDLTVNRI